MTSTYNELAQMLSEAKDRRANLESKLEAVQTDLGQVAKEINALELVIGRLARREVYTTPQYRSIPVQIVGSTPSATMTNTPEIVEAIMLAVREYPHATASKIAEVVTGLGYQVTGQGLSPRLQSLVKHGQLDAIDSKDGREYTVASGEATASMEAQ